MEDINIDDKGMSINGLVGFFLVFILIIPIPAVIAGVLLGLIGPTAANTGIFVVQVITYILLVKKLKKDYSLKVRLNFNVNARFYLFIIFIWIGYRLTYDNSIAILVDRLSPDSWIYEAFEKKAKYPITAILSMCVIAPIFEEVFCRGYVLDKLAKRYSKNKALIVSALFFAILHMNLIQGVNTFFVGIFLGLVYLKTNSLIPCIVIHFVNNTFGAILEIGDFGDIKLGVGICILTICGYIFLKDKKSSKNSVIDLDM